MFSTPGLNRKPSRASRMFTMSVKPNPPPKVPQPERLDEVYQSLKQGLQSVPILSFILQTHLHQVLMSNTCPCQVLLAGSSDGHGQPEQTNEGVKEELQTGKS